MSEPFWDYPLPSANPAKTVNQHRQRTYTSNADYLQIGQWILFPVEVSGKRRARTQSKNAPGIDGTNATHLGYDAAEIDVKLKIWTPDQWELWQTVVKALQPKTKSSTTKLATASSTPTPGAGGFGDLIVGPDGVVDSPQPTTTQAKPVGPQPFKVYHPFLAAYGINTLWVADVGLPKKVGKQIFEVALRLTEFNPQQSGSVSEKKLQATNAIATPVNPRANPAALPDTTQKQTPSQAATGPNTDPTDYTAPVGFGA